MIGKVNLLLAIVFTICNSFYCSREMETTDEESGRNFFAYACDSFTRSATSD